VRDVAVKMLVPGLWEIPLGVVNVWLLQGEDGAAIIDSGYPGDAAKILAGVDVAGVPRAEIRHIALTHCHPDHIGSAAELKAATGATVHIHRLDAAITRTGTGFRHIQAAPGLLNRALFGFFIARAMIGAATTPCPVDVELEDGDEVPVAGGLRAVFTPGHSGGHVAYLWPRRSGVLFAGDACANVLGLGDSIAYEDYAESRKSLARLAGLDFEHAVFGHGKPIITGASGRFRAKWGR